MQHKQFKGSGRLDAPTLNAMAQAGYAYAEQANTLPMPGMQGPFMVLINPPSGSDKVELAWLDETTKEIPIKWAYDYVFVSPEYVERDGEYLYDVNSKAWQSQGTYASTPSALNLAELNNSNISLMGVDPSNLPEGIELQPVPASTYAMVWLFQTPYNPPAEGQANIVGDEGVVAFFSYGNQFDGECP